MNTNDLPPAARLAALIEAGAAGNPDLKQRAWIAVFQGGTCALGFACLATGVQRKELGGHARYGTVEAIAHLAVPVPLGLLVATENDTGKSLPEICQSLREGELAKVPA